MDLNSLFEERKIALENKDFSKLSECAIKLAEMFNGHLDSSRHHAMEAAFFLGRLNNRERFEDLIYKPYYSIPASLREIRTFDKEEKMFLMGLRYPFLSDEELNYLEELYSSSDTYDMVSRMLYDGDVMLRRPLAKFNEDLFSVSNTSFSKKLCLEIFDAFIANYQKYNIQEALDERIQSLEDKEAEANFWGYTPTLSYSPILVYNRRTNSIQLDETDLTDRFLFPISNFGWENINLKDAIDLYKKYFGDPIIEPINESLIKIGLWQNSIEFAAFNQLFFMTIEKAVKEHKKLNDEDNRIKLVRESIARKWLTSVNEKPLR